METKQYFYYDFFLYIYMQGTFQILEKDNPCFKAHIFWLQKRRQRLGEG